MLLLLLTVSPRYLLLQRSPKQNPLTEIRAGTHVVLVEKRIYFKQDSRLMFVLQVRMKN